MAKKTKIVAQADLGPDAGKGRVPAVPELGFADSDPAKTAELEERLQVATEVARQAIADRGGSYFPEIDDPEQRAFLVAYSLTGNIRQVARLLGVDPRKLYSRAWRDNPVFQVCYRRAREIAADILEDEAWRRAVEGWSEPVFQKGQLMGFVRKYDGRILERLLAANIPDRFRDTLDIRALVGAIDVTRLTDEEIMRLRSGESPLAVLSAAGKRLLPMGHTDGGGAKHLAWMGEIPPTDAEIVETKPLDEDAEATK